MQDESVRSMQGQSAQCVGAGWECSCRGEHACAASVHRAGVHVRSASAHTELKAKG